MYYGWGAVWIAGDGETYRSLYDGDKILGRVHSKNIDGEVEYTAFKAENMIELELGVFDNRVDAQKAVEVANDWREHEEA